MAKHGEYQCRESCGFYACDPNGAGEDNSMNERKGCLPVGSLDTDVEPRHHGRH
jgi:hypothetical protein